MALRRAAIELMSKWGYDATTTDDIARAAGVSPRTFFNYFPSKESVVLLPDTLLSDLVARSLDRRPAGEDPVASMTVAAMDTVAALSALVGPDLERSLFVATMRLLFSEGALRRLFLQRRAQLEDTAWQLFGERGVAEEDLATRAALVSVFSLTYLALQIWVEGDGAEPLAAVTARCLLSAPAPARLAAGVTAIRSGGDAASG